MENCTNITMVTNDTGKSDATASAFVAVGVIHILLVVIPSLLFGCIILVLLLTNRNLKDPISIIFGSIAVVCILGPMMYGLLTDISLITDKPVIGSCDTPFGVGVFWFIYSSFHCFLLWITVLLSVTQYFLVQSGVRRVTSGRVWTAIAAIMLASLVFNIPNFASGFVGQAGLRIRGSVCLEESSEAKLIVDVYVFIMLILLVLSIATVIINSVLICRKVKQSIIEMKTACSVVLMTVLMITATILFRLPAIVLQIIPQDYFHNFATGPLFYQWVFSSYIMELNYPLYSFLAIVLHKSIRKTLVEMGKSLWRIFNKPSRITPI